ncbi:hypothetical protein KC19_2G076500 [Ceratodon purpureus]|uniref:Uncharacterized protein n=1 Tax=Ceratodon purpureus TaxID=3225 RepID=A0A8T0ITC9_CERPU|nr:hypothetical protein KC19_2G076500 [Ceratodon purpureus]
MATPTLVVVWGGELYEYVGVVDLRSAWSISIRREADGEGVTEAVFGRGFEFRSVST